MCLYLFWKLDLCYAIFESKLPGFYLGDILLHSYGEASCVVLVWMTINIYVLLMAMRQEIDGLQARHLQLASYLHFLRKEAGER